MKPSLQMKITQQLTLTPKLQQAIRLLQLSTLDLQQEIQQQLESNPMLEVSPSEEFEDSFPDVATETEDEFQWSTLYSGPKKENLYNENAYIFDTLYCTSTTLQDHLRWQLELTPITDIDKVIATAVIDAINPDGFLTLSLKDLHASLSSSSHPLLEKEIEAVIHRIQRFDPVGCAAANLQETLLIQLEQLRASRQQKELAAKMIRKDLSLLARKDYASLMKQYNISEPQLKQVLRLIHTLNPKPGSAINTEKPEYVIPDLTVRKNGDQWSVSLNQSILPQLSINSYYASLIKRANSSSENQFLKSSLQEARWFLKSIHSRQETLLKVAQYIVNYQKDFLNQGEKAMKPLILSQVAHALNMHESTISKVTTQKFILTPRGLFELKYFFSSHISAKMGQEYSSTAIRAFIKKLISEENPQKPLSDASIARIMEKQGIHVARRTIAKYREEMGIAPSKDRKAISRSL